MWFILIAVGVHLYFLPTTKLDYDFYEADYQMAFFNGEWPFFHTPGHVTAEPFYRFYSSVIRVLTSSSFQFYLSLNFLISIFLMKRSLFFITKNKYLFLLMALPVIIPTVFYYSPRSSISFVFVFLGLISLIYNRKLASLFFFLLGISTHSQYIPAVAYVLTVALIFKYYESNRVFILIIYNCLILLLLTQLASFIPFFSAALSFLPSAGVATSKLHYFSTSESGGFRVTSILSILVFPLMAYVVTKKYEQISEYYSIENKKIFEKIVFFVFSLTLLSMVVNISFINIPHLAGRLSRFSDYISFIFLIPFFFSVYIKETQIPIICVFFIILAPFLFPAIYS